VRLLLEMARTHKHEEFSIIFAAHGLPSAVRWCFLKGFDSLGPNSGECGDREE